MASLPEQDEPVLPTVDLADPAHVANWIEGCLRAIQRDPARIASPSRFAPFMPVAQGPTETDVALEFLTCLDGLKRAAWFAELRRGYLRFADSAANGALADALVAGLRFIAGLDASCAALIATDYFRSAAVARLAAAEIELLTLEALAACGADDLPTFKLMERSLRANSLWSESFELQKTRILIFADPWSAGETLDAREESLMKAFAEDELARPFFLQVLHGGLALEPLLWLAMGGPDWFDYISRCHWFRSAGSDTDAPIVVSMEGYGAWLGFAEDGYSEAIFIDEDRDEIVSLEDVARAHPYIARLPKDAFQVELSRLEARFARRFDVLHDAGALSGEPELIGEPALAEAW